MAKIEVIGIGDIKPEEPLCNGRYTVKINRSQTLSKDNGKMSLSLGMVVLAGPTQPDGSAAEDRRISDFFPLNGYETMKDGGTYSKQKLASAMAAAGIEASEDGFDSDDFIDATFDIITKVKDDLDGVPQTNITRYLKA
jgi:hypothetical protein